MKQFFMFSISVMLFSLVLQAQNEGLKPHIDRPVYFDISPPLRDMLRKAPQPADRSWKDGVVPNKFNEEGMDVDAGVQFLTDAALQNFDGNLLTDTTISNFNGLSAGSSVPPDTYGEAGPDYYFQVVNTSYAIYNKTGEIIFGPYANNSIWNGFPNNENSGDAVVLYDEAADRWLFSQFSLPNYPSGPFFQMIAVSVTSDPTGSWYRWQYEFPLMPDYPKFGVWADGYYMSSNNFGSSGFANNGAYGFDRDAMLAGETDPVRISFTLSAGGGGGFSTIYPADCDGTLPALGTPNYYGFIKRSSPQYFGIYEFHADFANPSNSTFSNLLTLDVTSFTSQLDGIPQPGTDIKLETISDRLMYRVQYRKFNGYEAMVANHTVNSGGGIAGVRWYEFRKSTGAWSIYQQGTYAPDNNCRWMGSIAMDTAGSIALGYSISSSDLHPSIRYTGRLKTDPLNQMTVSERTIIDGGGSQTGEWSGRSRWGDYSGMCVDPANPTTFWYTTEYYPTTSNSSWSTRIGSFTFTNVFSTFASASPEKICIGLLDTVQLNVIAYGGTGSYTYSWSSIPPGFTSNLQNPQVTPDDTTQYIVATTNSTVTRYDTVRVNVVYPPEAYAGEDTTICSWNSSIALSGTAENYRNFLWGTFGDGHFSDEYSLQTSYYPGDDDRTNGGVKLALLAFANTPCKGRIMDTLNLTIDPCTGIDEQTQPLSFRISPNPTREKTTLIIQSPGQSDCSVTVTGMDGKCIDFRKIRLEKGRTEFSIDLAGYNKGVYLIQLKTDREIISRQLVVH